MLKEIEIQKQILDYLKLKRIFHWRSNNIAVKGRTFTGLLGVADILALHDGIFYAIEVKNEKGQQSQPQVEFEFQVDTNGGRYILAKSVKDIEKLF